VEFSDDDEVEEMRTSTISTELGHTSILNRIFNLESSACFVVFTKTMTFRVIPIFDGGGNIAVGGQNQTFPANPERVGSLRRVHVHLHRHLATCVKDNRGTRRKPPIDSSHGRTTTNCSTQRALDTNSPEPR
jgi:hypothetical protein